MRHDTEAFVGSDNGATITTRLLLNDMVNKQVDDNATLSAGLTRGTVVKWSAANNRWEAVNGTVALSGDEDIGIVEELASTNPEAPAPAQVRIGGVYTDSTLTANTAYYVQADGTLGTTETEVAYGRTTSAGQLIPPGRGGSSQSVNAAIVAADEKTVPADADLLGIADSADTNKLKKITVANLKKKMQPSGFGNYIVEPFSVVPGTGVEVLLGPNGCVIDKTLAVTESQTAVALDAVVAQLIYKKKDGSYDKVLATYPAPDAGTVNAWVINGDAAIASMVGTNDLTRNGGISPVDGRIGYAAKDDSTGWYAAANQTGKPSSGVIGMEFLYKHKASGGVQFIGNWSANESYCFSLQISAANILLVGGQNYSTGYELTDGREYYIALYWTGLRFELYVDGVCVWVSSSSESCTYTAGTTNFLRWIAGNGYSHGTLSWVELRKSIRTFAEFATIARGFLIPCRYTADNTLTGGTIIGDATSSTAGAFDGVYGVNYNATGSIDKVVVGAGNSMYIGKTWNDTKIIEWFRVRGSLNFGICTYAPSAQATIKLQGSNDGFVNTVDLHNSGVLSNVGVANYTYEVLSGIDKSVRYRSMRVLITEVGGSGTHALSVNEIEWGNLEASGTMTDIRDVLPNKDESQVVTFVIAGSTAPTTIVFPSDPKGPTLERAYGMPIGPNGILNRIKKLAAKNFNGAVNKSWADVFGTSDVKFTYKYAIDVNGSGECDFMQGYWNCGYGICPAPTPAFPNTVAIMAYPVWNGTAYISSGYIICYAEVID